MKYQISVRIGESDIPIFGREAQALSTSGSFQQWLKRIKPESGIQSIAVEWVARGVNGEPRFALLVVHFLDRNGTHRPTTVFFRPDAVGIIVVVHNSETSALFAALVNQLRVPAGGILMETPAGTIEEDNDPVATAIREIEEETGFKVQPENLIDLGSYYLSPGACPEKMFFYACEFSLTSAEIEKLQGKSTGLEEEGEDIRLEIVPLFDLPNRVQDAKSVLAYYMYIDWKGKHLEKR